MKAETMQVVTTYGEQEFELSEEAEKMVQLLKEHRDLKFLIVRPDGPNGVMDTLAVIEICACEGTGADSEHYLEPAELFEEPTPEQLLAEVEAFVRLAFNKMYYEQKLLSKVVDGRQPS